MSKEEPDANSKRKLGASSVWTETWEEEKKTEENLQDFYSAVREVGRQVYLVEIPEDGWGLDENYEPDSPGTKAEE